MGPTGCLCGCTSLVGRGSVLNNRDKCNCFAFGVLHRSWVGSLPRLRSHRFLYVFFLSQLVVLLSARGPRLTTIIWHCVHESQRPFAHTSFCFGCRALLATLLCRTLKPSLCI